MKTLILPGSRSLRAWLWGAAMFTLTVVAAAQSPTASTFVGSEACRDCHEAEFNNHMAFAKKANSFASIERIFGRSAVSRPARDGIRLSTVIAFF